METKYLELMNRLELLAQTLEDVYEIRGVSNSEVIVRDAIALLRDMRRDLAICAEAPPPKAFLARWSRPHS